MISSELYLKSAESCFEKCKNSPATVDTYALVTLECTNNLKNFTQELVENFKNILVRLDEEDKKVKDQVHNLNSVTLNIESYLERRRRCTIGTICSPSPMENLSHFINNSPNSNVRTISKFLLTPSKLQNLTCGAENLETAKIDLKSCYMTETECTNNQLPTKLNGISCKKLQNNLSTLSPTSSFWNITETGKMPFKINTISIPPSNLLAGNAALTKNVKILSSINLSDVTKVPKAVNLNTTRLKEETPTTVNEPQPPQPQLNFQNSFGIPSTSSNRSARDFVQPPPIIKRQSSMPKHLSVEKASELPTNSDDSISEASLPPPPPDDMIESTIHDSDNESPPPPMVEIEPASPSPSQKQKASPVTYQVMALYSYDETNDVELSFVEGDIITIIQENPNQWDMGILKGKRGFVPRNFVKKI